LSKGNLRTAYGWLDKGATRRGGSTPVKEERRVGNPPREFCGGGRGYGLIELGRHLVLI